MFRSAFVAITIFAMLANQVLAAACHSHRGVSEAASRPHVHLGQGHCHCHGHWHEHHHGHSHDHPNDAGEDDSFNQLPAHDCDAFFVDQSDPIRPPTFQPIACSCSNVALTQWVWVSSQITSDNLHAYQLEPSCHHALAHALILTKIRLLL